MPKTDPALIAQWAAEVDALRSIFTEQGLDEVVRWDQPCFQAQGRNVVLIGLRPDRVHLLFFLGALLDDPDGVLRRPGPNSRVGRVLSVASVEDVAASEERLRGFLRQGARLAREGATVPPLDPEDLDLAPEIEEALDADPELAAAWERLTPGRKRGYSLHVSGAKKSATRARRFEACRFKIEAGKGFHDCVCGRSKRMPRCDGSHRKPA